MLPSFMHLGGLGCRGRNIQATKCVLGGKSRIKYCHLILTPPFRQTPNEAKGVDPIWLLRLIKCLVMDE